MHGRGRFRRPSFVLFLLLQTPAARAAGAAAAGSGAAMLGDHRCSEVLPRRATDGRQSTAVEARGEETGRPVARNWSSFDPFLLSMLYQALSSLISMCRVPQSRACAALHWMEASSRAANSEIVHEVGATRRRKRLACSTCARTDQHAYARYWPARSPARRW